MYRMKNREDVRVRPVRQVQPVLADHPGLALLPDVLVVAVRPAFLQRLFPLQQ
jgi:hypothetical protein